MSEQHSFNKIDSLVFQLVLQTQELSQKKNELHQEIKVCRANVAEKRLCIETAQKEIKKLDEEISVKQNTDEHNKKHTKCLRVANNLLLQYEQTLKAEVESRKLSFSNNMEVYEERITSYRATFQSHQEYYFQNPLAQELLMAQAGKEEIECRLKICDDQITMKRTELDRLTAPEVASFSTENLPDSIFVQQPTTEQEKQLDSQEKADCDMSIDLTALQLDQTRNGQKISTQVNSEELCDENPAEDVQAFDASSQNACDEPWSSPQSDEQRHFEDQDHITSELDNDLEQQFTVCKDQETVEKERGFSVEQQPLGPEQREEPAVFPPVPSQENNVHSFLAEMTTASSMSSSPPNPSPSSSPRQGTSDTKSPYFLFSTNSNPSTPSSAGFGFEPVLSQEEQDSPFAFTRSLFNEKKTSESKSPGCPEFLFGQAEQSEDFQFAFSESPQSANKGDSRQDFPFSFNF